MNYGKPVDGEFYRKPLRAEQEWHRNQYLSEQKSLKIKAQQARPTFTCLINTVKRNQEGTLPANEQSPTVSAGDIEMSWMVPHGYGPDPIATVVSDVTLTGLSPKAESNISQSSGDLLLAPIISKTTPAGPCSSSSFLKSNASHEIVSEFQKKESETESEQYCFEVNNVNQEALNTATSNSVPKPGRYLTIKIRSPEEERGRSVFLQEASSGDKRVLNTFQLKVPERKNISGSMVHEAIEETLNAVMRQSNARDSSGKETSVNRSPDKILKVSKEIML